MIKVNLDKKKLDSYKSTIMNEYSLLRRKAGQYKPKVEALKDNALAKLTTFRSRVMTRIGH